MGNPSWKHGELHHKHYRVTYFGVTAKLLCMPSAGDCSVCSKFWVFCINKYTCDLVDTGKGTALRYSVYVRHAAPRCLRGFVQELGMGGTLNSAGCLGSSLCSNIDFALLHEGRIVTAPQSTSFADFFSLLWTSLNLNQYGFVFILLTSLSRLRLSTSFKHLEA